MKVLIAPLNWGLGHASRSLALVTRYLRAGDEVVLAGDGESLTLLRKHFPNLKHYSLPPLRLRYSRSNSQVGAIALALPKLALSIVRDHAALRRILEQEHFDLVVSDNRFGSWTRRTRCAYITHQLTIVMPSQLRWLERPVSWLHSRIIHRYTECWVPDYAGADGLAGRLSHPSVLPKNVQYIGPLSRFADMPHTPSAEYDVVAVLSGLEPHRTLLENAIISEWLGREERVLIVRGLMHKPPMTTQKKNITLRPYMPDSDLASVLLGAKIIISRSGYSSLMDYAALGLLEKNKRGEVALHLVATPGQPEQEYLSSLFT